jgi:hypothetical protein
MNTVHIAILYSFVDVNPNCSDILSSFYLFCRVLASRKMLVYKKNKTTIHLHVIPVMKFGCVFREFAKRKLATRKDKIKIINTKRDGYVTCN